MEYNSLLSLFQLASIDGLGPERLFNLLQRFGTFGGILEAGLPEIRSVELVDKRTAFGIAEARSLNGRVKERLDTELGKLEKMNGAIITWWDEEYPEMLRNIYYPPLILYTLGKFTEADRYSIGIVGTRMATPYGKREAERFAGELAANRITIVSGLARGIDSIAHRAALDSGGRTIAVTGSGLDWIYPPENKNLYGAIAENGVVVTEYKMGAKPDAQNFPRRNRIISGLSLGTLLVETRENGGAMQTASYAIDQNREVFAIPGNVGSKQSEGTNMLIRKGEARLVREPRDIISDLELKLKPILGNTTKRPLPELTLFEQKILDALDHEPKHIDNIAAAAGMTTSECLVNLLQLEFKGAVMQTPGKMFMRMG